MAFGYRFPYLVWLGNRAWNTADRGTDFEVFLYDDKVDDPGDRAWEDAISSEPDDGNYERQTVAFNGHSVDAYETEVGAYLGDVTYDLSGVTGEVDAFGIVAPLEYFTGMGRDGTYAPGEMVDIFVASGPLKERLVLDNHSGNWTVEVGASVVPMY